MKPCKNQREETHGTTRMDSIQNENRAEVLAVIRGFLQCILPISSQLLQCLASSYE